MSKISPLLLEKYLRNECTEQEKEQVEAWYASIQGTPDFLDSIPETEQQQLQNETLSAIQERLTEERTPVVRTFPWGWTAWLAASVILALTFYTTYRDSADQIASFRKPAVTTARIASTQFINHKPRPVIHTLPDGSSVWMQAGASITYPKKFASDKRLVSFSGEGFFSVKKDKSCPFFIRSGEMGIKVLGTSFNVKALTNHNLFQVAVVTGKVQVNAPDHEQREQQVILQPRQQAVFEIDSKRLISSTIPSQVRKEIYEPITIVFDNTPLDQVIEKLQKRFNIKIRLSNPKIASCRLSADFEQQSLPLIMEMLCTALDASYTLSGKVILIDGLPCE